MFPRLSLLLLLFEEGRLIDLHSLEDMGCLNVAWGPGTEKDSRKKPVALSSRHGETCVEVSHVNVWATMGLMTLHP